MKPSVSPRPSLQNMYATKLKMNRSPRVAPIPIPAFAPVLRPLLLSSVLVAVGARSVVLTLETVEDSLVEYVELGVVLVLEIVVAATRLLMSVPSRAVDNFTVEKSETVVGVTDGTSETVVGVKADVISAAVKLATSRAAIAFNSGFNEAGSSLSHSCLTE